MCIKLGSAFHYNNQVFPFLTPKASGRYDFKPTDLNRQLAKAPKVSSLRVKLNLFLEPVLTNEYFFPSS